MGENVIAGACLCGAVRFEVSGPLDRVAHCHCTICQRAHGAAFVTWAALPSERVRVTAGDAGLVHYRSSEIGTRSFCRTCGSSMFCTLDTHPGVIDVALASLRRTTAPFRSCTCSGTTARAGSSSADRLAAARREERSGAALRAAAASGERQQQRFREPRRLEPRPVRESGDDLAIRLARAEGSGEPIPDREHGAEVRVEVSPVRDVMRPMERRRHQGALEPVLDGGGAGRSSRAPARWRCRTPPRTRARPRAARRGRATAASRTGSARSSSPGWKRRAVVKWKAVSA